MKSMIEETAIENILCFDPGPQANQDWIHLYDGELLDDEPVIEGQIAQPGPENLALVQQRYQPALARSSVDLSDLRILEIGAGFGRLTQALIQEYSPRHYIATEPFPSVLTELRKNLDGWGYQWPKGIAGALDANYPCKLQQGAVNLVVGNNVLHHITDYRRCIEHLASILDKPGLMIFVEPMHEAWAYWVSLIRMALVLDKASRRKLRLSQATRHIFSKHIENLEKRMTAKGQLEYLSQLEDKHFFSIPELMDLAHANGLRFYCHTTSNIWINTVKLRLKNLRVSDAEQERLIAFFEEVIPGGLEETAMKDFAMTISIHKD